MKNQKGFSIIEVMVAMVIFGMGMMCAIQLHYSTTRNNGNGNFITLATMAAKDRLENLRGQNIYDLVEGTYAEQVGPVALEYTITKDPVNTRLGRVEVRATLRGKTVRYSTLLNNTWGKNNGVTAVATWGG